MSAGQPDLREVRRRAAVLIDRDGHAVVDECIGQHGLRRRRADNGPRCATTAVLDALAAMGYEPSLLTADAIVAIVRALRQEVGADWFPHGDSLYYWNDYNTKEEILDGLLGATSEVAA